ncbi:MAG: beta-lactamase family protein [Turneriella sp.]|nr:beta-lactamase family protein [Turneriella sp.]
MIHTRWIVYLWPVFAATCTFNPETGCQSSLQKSLIRVDQALDRYVQEKRVAGVVALVWRDGKPIYERATGWSDREAAIPMRMDSIFRIASMTKAMASAAALMLAEEKKLGFHEKVSKYIPEFEKQQVLAKDPLTGAISLGPVTTEMTIHHLLTHTSGLSYASEPELAEIYRAEGLGPALGANWNLSGLKEEICETSAKLGKLPLAGQPGGPWLYGYSTDVLGCIIEQASKMKLDEFFRKRIIEPLGMKDTHFFMPQQDVPRLTALYGTNKDGIAERSGGNKAYPYAEGYRKSFSAGAGLVSTAGDYAKFLEMIRRSGELNGKRLLKPETVKLMTYSTGGAGAPTPSGFTYGFEIAAHPGVSGESAVQSYGWIGAYGTFYRVDPRQKLVIVLMTQLAPNGTDIRDRFWQALYDALAEAKALY